MRAQKLPPPDESRLAVHLGGHATTDKQCQRMLYQFDLRVDPPDGFSPDAYSVYPAAKTLKGRPLEMTRSLQDLYRWLAGYETGYRRAYREHNENLLEKPEVEFEPAVE